MSWSSESNGKGRHNKRVQPTLLPRRLAKGRVLPASLARVGVFDTRNAPDAERWILYTNH